MCNNCGSAFNSVYFFLLTVGHIPYLSIHEFLNYVQGIVYKGRISAKVDFIFSPERVMGE